MNKIVVAIDSFKGSLSSREADEAAEQGIKTIFPQCEVLHFPVADGGEGILEILTDAFHGHTVPLVAHNPLMQKITTQFGISEDGRTALVEMARISGLPLLPPSRRNPMLTTSYGLGEIIAEALNKGCRHFIIGIGGSATNDAGLGMLQALGFRFFDHDNKLLGTGGQILSRVAAIDTTAVHPALSEASFTIACDVDNPFYGPRGATRIFAGQKGATPEMTEHLEAGMQAIAAVIAQTTGKDIGRIPGSGAAGGVGGAFLAFTNARLMSGIDLILTHLQFGKRIQNADLIITGEGSADAQTTMGKVAYGILREARKQNIPVLLVAGHIADTPSLYTAGFSGIFSIAPGPVPLEKSVHPEFAATHLQRLITQICKLLQAFRV